MTLTIDIPDETIDQVRAAAAANGMDVETFTARAAITTAGAFAIAAGGTGEGHREEWDDIAWWRNLSDQERAAEIEALRVSLAAADAGRVRTAEHVFALMGAKG